MSHFGRVERARRRLVFALDIVIIAYSHIRPVVRPHAAPRFVHAPVGQQAVQGNQDVRNEQENEDRQCRAVQQRQREEHAADCRRALTDCTQPARHRWDRHGASDWRVQGRIGCLADTAHPPALFSLQAL